MNLLKGKTVLVTGSNGFIGSHLCHRLSKITGIHLLLLSRQKPILMQDNIQYLHGSLHDLTKEFWLQQGIDHIDVVFHLAAFIPKSQAEANQVENVFCDNLIGTKILLAGLPSGVQRIVFSSTVDVYDPHTKEQVITEESVINPSNLYGASKLFCERLVIVWAKQRDCQYSILRYGHIFGPGEEAYAKLIPMVIRTILAGKNPTVYGKGLAQRDFLYVGDAVEATLRAATLNHSTEAINIVRGQSNTIGKIVEILIEKSKASVAIDFLEKKPDGYSLRFNNARMLQTLGTWSLLSLADGLEKEIKTFRG